MITKTKTLSIAIMGVLAFSGCGQMEDKVTDLNPVEPTTPVKKPSPSQNFPPGFQISSGATVAAKSTSMIAVARLGKVDSLKESSSTSMKMRTGVARQESDKR